MTEFNICKLKSKWPPRIWPEKRSLHWWGEHRQWGRTQVTWWSNPKWMLLLHSNTVSTRSTLHREVRGAVCSCHILKWNEYMDYKYYPKVGYNSRNIVYFRKIRTFKFFFSNGVFNGTLKIVQWGSTDRSIRNTGPSKGATTILTDCDTSAKSRWLSFYFLSYVF